MKQRSMVLALCTRSQGHPVFYNRLIGLLDKFEEWDPCPPKPKNMEWPVCCITTYVTLKQQYLKVFDGFLLG